MPQCFVCKNNKFTNILKINNLKVFSALKDFSFSEKYSFDAVLQRCKKCGFVQQNQSSKLQKFLASFYAQKESFFTAPPAANTLNNRTKFSIAFLNKFIKTPVVSILEIGCYDGYFLDLLRKNFRAKESVGIEILRLRNRFPKLSIINDYFPTNKIAEKKFDLVVLMNVLEHVFSPRDFMLAIKQNLKENGKMLIEIPNEELAFKFGALSYQHQHISYFTPTTINIFLSSLGFKIDAIYTKDNDRILLLCSKRTITSAIPVVVDKSSIGYSHRQRELIKKFKKIIKSDLFVGLYGACNFTHNILQDVGVASNILIFDGDYRKKDKFMSNINNSIRSWKEIDSSNIKKLIIMPLAFTPEIYKFLTSNKIKTPIIRLFKDI